MIETAPELVDAWMDWARVRKHMGDMAGALADAAHVKEMEDEMIAQLRELDPPVLDVKRFNLDEE